MLIFEATYAYSAATLEGRIYDKETKEPLTFTPIGLYTLDKKLLANTESDVNGDYFFGDIKEGNYYIWAAYIGYNEIEIDISIKGKQDLKVNIEMVESTILLETIVCSAAIFSHCGCYSSNCGIQVICSFGNFTSKEKLDAKSDYTFSNELSIDVYPNPAVNKLFVNTKQQISELSILTYNGILLKHQLPYTNNAEIDIATLPNGLYILQIDDGEKKITKKFTKFE